MGLDMCLYVKKFIWSSFPGREKNDDDRLADSIKFALGPGLGRFEVRYVILEAAYWRKANHIHKWFVDNVQKGVDDCGNYECSYQQLRELRDLCARVVDDPSLGPTYLPTQDGFFFGGTDYDEYYVADCRRTVETLDPLLALESDPKHRFLSFEYHSSW